LWGGSVCPEAALVYVPEEWVGESCVIHGAHLFVLPIDAQAGLEPSLAVAEKKGANFSQCSAAFIGYFSYMILLLSCVGMILKSYYQYLPHSWHYTLVSPCRLFETTSPSLFTGLTLNCTTHWVLFEGPFQPVFILRSIYYRRRNIFEFFNLLLLIIRGSILFAF
jgi:hypothetical protein